jgi:hypothetical protein
VTGYYVYCRCGRFKDLDERKGKCSKRCIKVESWKALVEEQRRRHILLQERGDKKAK